MQHGGAPESALSWPWGNAGSWWAFDSEAFEMGVSADTLENWSRRESQSETEFLALPWRELGGALLGATPGLRGVQLTRLQAWSA